MKLAFVENRYKTAFWSAVAHQFSEMGHEVIWFVQNPIFTPNNAPLGSVYVVPFPRSEDLSLMPLGNSLSRVVNADRNVNYFNGNSAHYLYYRSKIELWIDKERPDVVFGESTLFHELLTADVCKNKGILYCHPSMPGYPGGRFSIYLYDTKSTIGQSEDVPDDCACFEIVEAIIKRNLIPDYMRSTKTKLVKSDFPKPGSLKDRLIVLRGYLAGERYNTPAPWLKLKLDRSVKKYLALWNAIAEEKNSNLVGKRIVLYPMQMQPESNIDLWGQDFRDQTTLISELESALPEGWHLVVKLNPKVKYELTSQLLQLVRSKSRISPLNSDVSMSAAFDAADLICTVTGTVAVECVLAGKPVAQFGPGVTQGVAGSRQVNDPFEVKDVIYEVKNGTFSLAAEKDKFELIRKLFLHSFSGRVSDPGSLPSVLDIDNVRAVARALVRVGEEEVEKRGTGNAD